MAEPTRVWHAFADNSGGAQTPVTPGTAQVGDWVIIAEMAEANNVTFTPSGAANGWTTLAYNGTVGTRTVGVYATIRAAGDGNYSIAKSSAVNGHATVMGGAGADAISKWVVGTPSVRASSTNITTAPSLTTTVAGGLVIALGLEATSAADSTPTVSGATNWYYDAQDSAVETAFVNYIDQATAGATGTVTMTYTNAAANGWGIQIAVQPVASAGGSGTATVVGTTNVLTTSSPTVIAAATATSTATVSAAAVAGQVASVVGTTSVSASGNPAVAAGAMIGGTSTVTASASPRVAAASTAFGTSSVGARTTTFVDNFLARAEPDTAHFGGDVDTPPGLVAQAYRNAIAWAADIALEVDFWITSDGVAVCSHDQSTDIFTTTYDIPSTPWATLAGLTTKVGGYPILRLDDFLAEFAVGSRVIVIDNKGIQSTSTILAMLDTYGGSSRFIIKAYAGSYNWARAAVAWDPKYQSWGYFYDADVTNTPTYQQYFTTIGLNYDATSGSVTTVQSWGKQIWAHIVDTFAHRTQASSWARGYMASGVREVVPQQVPTALATGMTTVTIAASPRFSGSASVVGQTVVSAAGTVQTASTTAVVVGSTSVAASGSSIVNASATVVGTTAVTATGSAHPAASVTVNGMTTVTAAGPGSAGAAANANVFGTTTVSAAGTATIAASGSAVVQGTTSVTVSSSATIVASGDVTVFGVTTVNAVGSGGQQPLRDITVRFGDAYRVQYVTGGARRD